LLRYLTAGESHGKALVTILDGMPAGLSISTDLINADLKRRQQGYGRGGRMQIEQDRVEIISGIRFGQTMGTPITLQISNRDWENWQTAMQTEGLETLPEKVTVNKAGTIKEVPVCVTKPRPGHADLVGGIKYRHNDLRNVLERASARETAVRVAVGAVAKRLLAEFGIEVLGHVVAIGGIKASNEAMSIAELRKRIDVSSLCCADPVAETMMRQRIAAAKATGDTLGGIFEVIVENVPLGLGDFDQWDRKIDGILAQALMSIQGIKGVEVGKGFMLAEMPGSAVHDALYYHAARGYYRQSNSAGGIEGGMTNGERIILRAAMKPIPTLYRPLPTVDIATKEPCVAAIERSDVCAVPAAAVVGEAVVAFAIAREFLIKFGGDSVQEIKERYDQYCTYIRCGDK